MPEVSAAEAKQIIDSGAQLIDVRTEAEFEAGHIPGARHVPVAEIQRRAGEFDNAQPVVVYCRSGDRSGPVADAFAASGWDAHSIEGGLVAWNEGGQELEPAAGSVAANPNMPPR
jgi:rhodanese-related sulfurtransferase